VADSGWPTDDDLAGHAGGVAVDANVVNANAAARADAISVGGLDADAGVADAAEWLAVLDLGLSHLQRRNRPDGPDGMYPSSHTYGWRIAMSVLLRRGMPIA
jgi:hypothetical protein